MAVKFLDNLNLVGNQLLNTKLQVLAGNPTGVAILGEGQIFFDSSAGVKAFKYYNGTDWIDPVDGIDGSGSINTLAMFTASETVGDSIYSQNGGATEAKITGGFFVTGYLKDSSGGTGTSGQLLSSTGTATDWVDAPVGYTKWVLTGDSGTQDIEDGNTVLITGGTGLVTQASATDTLTITPAFNEYSSATPESNAGLLFGIDGDMSNSEMRYQEVNSFSLSLFGQPTDNIGFNSKKITSLLDPTAAQDAATKAYVDSSVAGGLNVKGGFNANTGIVALTSVSLYTATAVAVGDYYIVTTAGDFFGQASTPLTVGDSVLCQTASAAPASITDFAVIQSDTDLATAATVGIGNVNASAANNKEGLSLSYSNGTGTVGFDIKNGLSVATAVADGDAFAMFQGSTEAQGNFSITSQLMADYFGSKSSFAGTSSSGTSHVFTHNLNTADVIVQVYDASTLETVYANVDRTSVNQVTVTTAATANIRCLVQKIG